MTPRHLQNSIHIHPLVRFRHWPIAPDTRPTPCTAAIEVLRARYLHTAGNIIQRLKYNCKTHLLLTTHPLPLDMQPRLFVFAAAFRSAAPLSRGRQPVIKIHSSSFVCQGCQRKFSTSPNLRFFGKSAKEGAKTAEKDRSAWKSPSSDPSCHELTTKIGYPSRLLIYDAGDARTTWISFWKAMALLQFGTTLVFGVPPLWNNENQPDPRLRKMQAILGECFPFCFHLIHSHSPLGMLYDFVWCLSRDYLFEDFSNDFRSRLFLSQFIFIVAFSFSKYVSLFCILTTILTSHATPRHLEGHMFDWHSNSSPSSFLFHYTAHTQPTSNNPTQSASLAPSPP